MDAWIDRGPRGTLALIVLLDQFSRNIHRGTPRAFAQDPRALAMALEAIEAGVDRRLGFIERAFVYLPLEHAEDLRIQERSWKIHLPQHVNAGAYLITFYKPAGVDPELHVFSVDDLLAQKNVQTTQIYARVLDEKKKAAVNRIPNIDLS